MVGWAEYGLGFTRVTRTTTKGWWIFKREIHRDIYMTTEGNVLWQENVGYIWLYDWVFSLFSPIKRLVYPFTKPNGAGLGKDRYYALWMWKADYWNLGPGAEIGLYYTDDPKEKDEGHYWIDPESLKVKAHMKVTYNGFRVKEVILDFEQINWWVCAFAPWVADEEKIDEKNIAVQFDVTYDFPNAMIRDKNGNILRDKDGNPIWQIKPEDYGVKHTGLWEEFKKEVEEWHSIQEWKEITLSAPSDYQFRINY